MTSPAFARPRQAPASSRYARAVDGAIDTLFGLNDTATTELLLVRHGEPGLRGPSTNGSGEPGLSDRGRLQAMRLAMRLRRLDLDFVYASTLRACVETAALVAAAKDLPVVRVPQLRDLALDPQALNGSANDERKLIAEVSVRFINNPRWDSLPGVEPTRPFRHRVVQAVEAIVSRHPGGRVAVVAPQPVINAYISMVLGIERDMFFQPEFTSLSTVRILRDLYAVQTINDYAHLLPTFEPK